MQIRRTGGKHLLIHIRDNWTCQYCGYNVWDMSKSKNLGVDHILPYSAGGSYDLNNLVTACDECNGLLCNRLFNSFEDKKLYIIKRLIYRYR